MNKILYEYCQRNLRTVSSSGLKLTASFKTLYRDYHIGKIDNGYFYFTEKDRQALIEQVQLDTQTHLFRDPYPEKQSRQKTAKTQRNEKINSYAVTRDFILVNSLQSLQINNQAVPINELTSLGLYLKADEIISVEHSLIILVENLEIMANLSKLNISESLHNALWLYRGDIKNQQKTSSAYQFFRRFIKSHQLICFSDLDPKGIEIALTSGAQYWLTAEDDDVINMALQGQEKEWFKQQSAIKYLQGRSDLPEKCKSTFQNMRNSRKTFKQEHMLKHHIKLALYPL